MQLSNKACAWLDKGRVFDARTTESRKRMGRMEGKRREGGRGNGRDYPDKPIRASAANHVPKGPGLCHAWAVSFHGYKVAAPPLHWMSEF